MIRRGVKVQLAVFGLLAMVVIAFTGAHYVGLGTLLPGHGPMKVTAMFPDSGGIYSTAEVTERGVTVGKVGKLTLTKDGVAVQLLLDHGTKINKDARAVVANLSFVGEQYVDLQPTTSNGPFLKAGDVIAESPDDIPISDTTFLNNLDRLVRPLDPTELHTVVDGLGTALDGAGPELQEIIDKGNEVLASAEANLPETLDLIRQGQGVLATAQQTGGELRDFSKSLASLTDQLKASDPDVRSLLTNGIASAQQLDGLLKDNEKNLTPLLGNLVTLGEIQAARLPGLKQLLLLYPEDLRNGFLNAPGDGTSHFGLVNDTGGPVCEQGYENTKHRTGEELGDTAANLKAYCNSARDSTTDVKGSRNAPRPAGDCTDPALLPGAAAAKGGQCISTPQSSSSKANSNGLAPSKSSSVSTASTSSSSSASGSTQLVSYDPLSQTVSLPDGSVRWIERTNGQADLMGATGWKWFILGPLSSGL